MQRDKGKQYAIIMDRMLNTLQKPIDLNGDNFETMFKFYDEIEDVWGGEVATGIIQLYARAFCEGDENLVELFNIANQRRKEEESEESKRIAPIAPDDDDEDTNLQP